ncbi:MAG: PLP-dependent transferase [Desulfofustis sp.]|nr:PLP-dependent transferase [Desulfofustis sp.]
MKKQTQCVHSGTTIDPSTRGINTPIYTSSAFHYLDSAKKPYPRYFNTPNQEAVVAKLCALEEAEDGLLFSSGMAAVSTAILAFAGHGDHVILQDEIYGGTHALVTGQLSRLGIDYSFVGKTAESFVAAMNDRTRVIYLETPTNPLLGIVDISAITTLARQRGIVTIIDNTFASPINQTPLALGVDVVVHSGTKYLGGHSDLCCGAALFGRELGAPIRNVAVNLGGSLNAESCALLERSLKTLHLRVTKQTENAAVVASFLATHALVSAVYYPGLEDHPGHAVARRQMSGFGAMLSFELGDDAPPTDQFLKGLQLIAPALSLGGVESTICDPARTSHSKMSAEERRRVGISERLLRLSIGIEHPDDLITDLDRALSR